MKTVKDILRLGIGIAIFCLWVYIFQARSIKLLPNEALLLVKGDVFYTPPCIMKVGYDNVEMIYDFAYMNELEVMRFEDLPENCVTECNENAENKRAFYVDLEKWGILPKSRQRWNSDGSWNY
jgi:hypothetical protein